MTKVDQFESVFRAASKEIYSPAPVALKRALVLHDLGDGEGTEFVDRNEALLASLGDDPEWSVANSSDFPDLDALLGRVTEWAPDLVCTYRNLDSEAWRWPYSLGEHLDVLTQIAPCPVLVSPHPRDKENYERALRDVESVMAVTDHLAGDAQLVDWGRHFTATGSTLCLAHVEDERAFLRYIDAISKVASIDTEQAREALGDQLLKEPRDYIESCRSALVEAGAPINATGDVRMGQHLAQYRELVRAHDADLLVMETRDEGQLAMHGLAYPIAIELREIPILML